MAIFSRDCTSINYREVFGDIKRNGWITFFELDPVSMKTLLSKCHAATELEIIENPDDLSLYLYSLGNGVRKWLKGCCRSSNWI
jgi:hypothetical protein